MKRIIVCICLVMLFTSCSGKVDRQIDFQQELNGKISTEYNGIGYTAEYNAEENGNINLCFVQPSELSGIKMTVSAEGTKIECDGIELDYSEEMKTPFNQLYPAFIAWRSENPKEIKTSGEYLCADFSDEINRIYFYIKNRKIAKIQVNKTEFIIEQSV